MKYSRMLCWIRPREKKELEEAANGQFPLVFAKKYDDFKNSILDGDYIVVSFTRASNRLRQLIRTFSNNTFSFYEIKEKYIMTSIQFDIVDEPNVTIGQYGPTELINNYLGIIPDLWEMRLRQTFKSLNNYASHELVEGAAP